ncbi:MAG: BrnT family toxin [Candidatus Sulfotelmatobacter sp.]|jgi:uncharacterized DUF497 family protein
MRIEWDEAKNRRNLLKHAVRFETAALAFEDPYALTQRDESTTEEERWITLGSLGPATVLFVVHTWRERSEEEIVRIIWLAPRHRARGIDMRKLTKEQKRDIAAIAAMKDEDIDLFDMPEVLDWSKAEMDKFYRPPKRSVTMRLDGDVIDWLKGYGKGYQTRVNLLLRHAMASTTSENLKSRQHRPARSRA